MGLLAAIEHHCRATGTSVTRFGRTAVRDPRFVHDLRLGRTPRPDTVAKVAALIEAGAGR